MKNRWKKAWKELCGNRGSGVVLALVAISCITLMTTSLLHMTYTYYKIKMTERQSKVDYYSADARMDELLVCIQNMVSTVIGDAHKATLVQYVTPLPVDPSITPTLDPDTYVQEQNSANFQKAFFEGLEKKFGVSSGKYSATEVAKHLEHLEDIYEVGTIAITENGDYKEYKTGNDKRVVLKDIQLTYRSSVTDNVTSVKTDIVIRVPEFLYVKPGSGAVNDTGAWKIEELVTFENWSTY